MGHKIAQDKLKALTAVLAKDIKSEQVLRALSQQFPKRTVETALNADMGAHRGDEKHTHTVKEAATIEMAIPLNAEEGSKEGAIPKIYKYHFLILFQVATKIDAS